MLHFRYSTLINAPVEVVWKFHERSDILQTLTPPWQPVQIIRHQGGLEIGAISEFIIWLGPIPVKWVAIHTEYEEYRLFTDQQKEGPMESWTHRHQFSEEDVRKASQATPREAAGGSTVKVFNGLLAHCLHNSPVNL